MAGKVAAATTAAVTSAVPSSTNVLLALGSNIGRSSLTLSRAVQSIRSLPSTTLVATSHLYHTPPAYVLDQPSFLNAACHIRTSLTPVELFTKIKELERDAGRDFNGVRNGPRPLDIDIISMCNI
jgi:dihydroneopterin aldolase/2-amino-4-hydroxy-6-hydroxymethyldihydropteridine diphosphokinase/dihydropteroate synthase